MRITLVISSLSSGGAERVMSTMANYWAEKGWNVTLVTLDAREADFYALHRRVRRIAIDVFGRSANPLSALKNNLARIVCLRRSIRQSRPEAIISFMDRTNVLTLLSVVGLGLKVVISERTDPSVHSIGKIWNFMRRVTYPLASAIIVQSESVKNWLARFAGRAEVLVIPNPVHLDEHKSPVEDAGDELKKYGKKILMAMGRLGPEKGFDLLIRSFSKIAQKQPAWSLVILGEGSERGALERLIEELNMTDRVFLPGRTKRPTDFLKQADLFVMSSRYEGFPNALLEAMACGLPVISFDCPSGPREIIRAGIDGVLVDPEDADALSDAMEMLMENEGMRSRLATRAPDVFNRFGLEKIMSMWERAILPCSD